MVDPFFFFINIDKAGLNKKITDIFNSSDFNKESPSDAFESFSKLFYESFKQKAKSKTKPPNPWWNSTCNKAGLKRAVSNFTYCPSKSNYVKLVEEKKTYKHTIRTEKRKGGKTSASQLTAICSFLNFGR